MVQRVDRLYTFEEFEEYSKTQRSEWIDGIIYDMSGASINHGRVVRRLGMALNAYLEGKPCELFFEDIEVQFLEEMRPRAALQPDLKVVCEKEKIHKNAIIGAPTLVIEVVSPSSTTHDYIRKRRIYERNGVPEYWIVSPEDRTIVICVWNNGTYVERVIVPKIITNGVTSTFFARDEYEIESDIVTSSCFPGFSIEVSKLFDDMM